MGKILHIRFDYHHDFLSKNVNVVFLGTLTYFFLTLCSLFEPYIHKPRVDR